MVGSAWQGTPLKFSTVTLPPEIDAGRPSLSVGERVSSRRFKRYIGSADRQGRMFVWQREVGPCGGRCTRWAQTIIAKVPRQVPRGTPDPRGWLADTFPRFATERAVRACFDLEIARREREVKRECDHAPHGEVWSPLEDDAWAPRPPSRSAPPRLGTFSRIPLAQRAAETLGLPGAKRQ